MKYKLMLIDCDRTLLNDQGMVSPRTERALRAAISQGVKVVFASGRAPGGIANVVKAIGAKGLFDYFVCFNGGMIVRAQDGHVVDECPMVDYDVEKIVDSIACAPADCYVLTRDRLLCPGDNAQATIEAEKNGMRVVRQDIRRMSTDEKVYKMVVGGEVEKVDVIDHHLPGWLRRAFNVTRSEPNNLEFVPLGASKGHALMMLATMLKIPITDTISFGDSENDKSMLTMAGTGVAMGNAHDTLKSIADHVTDSNNDDGLAKAIEALVLAE